MNMKINRKEEIDRDNRHKEERWMKVDWKSGVKRIRQRNRDGWEKYKIKKEAMERKRD